MTVRTRLDLEKCNLNYEIDEIRELEIERILFSLTHKRINGYLNNK